MTGTGADMTIDETTVEGTTDPAVTVTTDTMTAATGVWTFSSSTQLIADVQGQGQLPHAP
jgi:hypothetical protein